MRKTAEHYLKDMVQLVFMRLPQFAEDPRVANMKFLKMKAGNVEQTRTKKKTRSSSLKMNKPKSGNDIIFSRLGSFKFVFVDSESIQPALTTNIQTTTNVVNQASNIVDMQGSISQNTSENLERAVSPPLNTTEKKIEDGEQEQEVKNVDECSNADATTSCDGENVEKVRNSEA